MNGDYRERTTRHSSPQIFAPPCARSFYKRAKRVVSELLLGSKVGLVGAEIAIASGTKTIIESQIVLV